MKRGVTAAALAALAGAAGMFAPPQGAASTEPKVSSTTTPAAKTPMLPAQGGFFQQMARAFMASGRNSRGGLGGYRKWPRGSHKQKRRIAMRGRR